MNNRPQDPLRPIISVTLLSCLLFFPLSLHPAGLPLLHPFRSVSLGFRAETLIIIQSVGVLINSRCETTWKAGCAARLNSLKCQLIARARGGAGELLMIRDAENVER